MLKGKISVLGTTQVLNFQNFLIIIYQTNGSLLYVGVTLTNKN